MAAWYWPAAQTMHTLAPLDEYQPTEQADAPLRAGVAQNEPASHTLQAVAPAAGWYLPAAHATQLKAELAGA